MTMMKGRRAQMTLAASSLMALMPANSLRAADLYWRPDDDANSWFETDNWDPDHVPGPGESVEVNVDTSESTYYTANLRAPSPEEQDAYFTSTVFVENNYYKVYRIGNLVIANDQGTITNDTPAMYLNPSGSRTTNGILHGFGLISGPTSIGKNTYDGFLRFAGGLWEPSTITVGDNAKGYFKQNGGILITQNIGVAQGLCDITGGKVSTDSFSVSSRASLADIGSTTLTIDSAFQNLYGGQFQTDHSAIDIGYKAAPGAWVFYNDPQSDFTQDGGSITVRGLAVMSGRQTIGGAGGFAADSAHVNIDPAGSKSLRITGPAYANLGVLEIGTSGGSQVDVLDTSTLAASSILMGRTTYYDTIQNLEDSFLNIAAHAEVTGAMTLGAPLVPPSGPGYSGLSGMPAYVTVTAGGTLTAGSISVSQSATGKGELKTFTGGKVSVTGDLKVGDAPAADGSIQSYDTGSEIAGNKIWIGKEAGSKGTAYATNGGALRAPDTVILGSLTGASDASLTVGGVNPAGGFFGPGPVISPSILRAGTTPTNTRVIFQHNAAAYSFDPRLQYVDLVTSTGTGRTTLNGRIWDTGVVQATAGTLEIKYNQVPNTTDFLVAQDSGNIEINGAIVKTPDVAFARTLIGVIGSGEVTVLGGGRLESSIVVGSATPGATTSGTLNVQGVNSTVLVQGLPLRIGIGNRGNLRINDGGRVINNDPAHTTDAVLGDAATGFGDVIVTGAGSRWDVGNLTAGNQGKSTMLVNGGGTLATGGLVLGSASGSNSDLTVGDSSTVQVAAASMRAGNAGRGGIMLKDGGKLRVGPTGQGDLVLGNQAGGSGELDIGSGGSPGSISAKTVYSGTGSALVKVSHQLEGYVFAPTLFEVKLQIGSGHIGTTALTSPDNFLSRCSVTSGGLRLSQGGRVTMDDTMVIG
ncbi:MAG: autotransporter outer rane beta-barrel protein, partial [Akkermansiaceae bacterium]|nr:autotransporter outer rane beta-barrel protein [Akkermansiaceae bacterium]